MLKLARWCISHRRRVVVGWVAIAVLTTIVAGVVDRQYATNFSLPGTESQRASDLLQHEFKTQSGDLDTIVAGLDHLRYNNHEVIIWHIMDPYERDLAVDGHVRFRDLESGETLTTQAEGVREAYKKAVDDWRQALDLECRKRAIDRIELTTEDAPDRALLDYLVKRARTF